MKKSKIISIILSAILLVNFGVHCVYAQDGTPGTDPSNAWSGIIAPDGSLAEGAVDNGVQTISGGGWFPSLPGPVTAVLNAVNLGSQAEPQVHVWTGPNGNVVVQPANALTALAMAANPQTSGFNNSEGQYYQGAFGGSEALALASLANWLGGTGSPAGNAPVWTNNIAGAILSNTNAISTLFTDHSALNILTNFTMKNWSPFMLAYSNACSSPAGCSAALTSLTPLIPPGVVPPSCPASGCLLIPTPPGKIQCPSPLIIQGKITPFSNKSQPNYAIVVGQDPIQRGVDLVYNLTISPTIYRTWELIEEHKTSCSVAVGNGGSCPAGNEVEYVSGYHCDMHEQDFCESVVGNPISEAHLNQSSRDWILNELADYYPGA